MGSRPGELNGVTGVATIEDEVVAKIAIYDHRYQEVIEFRMRDGEVGRKPGRITGELMIRFDEFAVEPRSTIDTHAAERLQAELGRRAEGQRSETDPVFDLVLDAGAEISGCRVGGYFGALPGLAGIWFGLELPE